MNVTWSKFFSGLVRKFDQLFLGKEQYEKIREQEIVQREIQEEAKNYTLPASRVKQLGPYGQQLQDLNNRRYEIAKSLAIFEGDESALDIGEIKTHMRVLYEDAEREAHRLSMVSTQLNMGDRPDTLLKEQILGLSQRIDKTSDPAIRENLIETANSKTKSLIELGKIAIYTTRVKTKVDRLEAFLGELQLGAMRAGLEEDSDYHKDELANSMKAIRSSFAAVDDFRAEVKLLTESEEKQDEEVPYYLRYKEVWAGKGAASGNVPPQEPVNPEEEESLKRLKNLMGEAGLTSSSITDLDKDSGEQRTTTGNRSTSTQTRGGGSTKKRQKPDDEVHVECPICGAVITFKAQPKAVTLLCACHNLLRISYDNYHLRVEPLACPHCGNPGPYGEVSISYHDGLTRYHCGSCNKYFIENDPGLKESYPDDWTRHTNVKVNRHCRADEFEMSKMIADAVEAKHFIVSDETRYTGKD